jgi:hypothetical protein
MFLISTAGRVWRARGLAVTVGVGEDLYLRTCIIVMQMGIQICRGRFYDIVRATDGSA